MTRTLGGGWEAGRRVRGAGGGVRGAGGGVGGQRPRRSPPTAKGRLRRALSSNAVSDGRRPSPNSSKELAEGERRGLRHPDRHQEVEELGVLGDAEQGGLEGVDGLDGDLVAGGDLDP